MTSLHRESWAVGVIIKLTESRGPYIVLVPETKWKYKKQNWNLCVAYHTYVFYITHPERMPIWTVLSSDKTSHTVCVCLCLNSCSVTEWKLNLSPTYFTNKHSVQPLTFNTQHTLTSWPCLLCVAMFVTLYIWTFPWQSSCTTWALWGELEVLLSPSATLWTFS